MTTYSPAKYRTTNWPTYNAALKSRGSMMIWIDKEMSWHGEAAGKRGRIMTFSDAAIQFWPFKGLFSLPLRQTTEFVESLLSLAGLTWPVPYYSTLCRRQKNITVDIP